MSAQRQPPVQFRPGEDILGALRARAPDSVARGAIARRDLQRYYAVLADSLASLRLDEREASLVVNALRGVIEDEAGYRLMWAGISDAIEGEDLASKWGLSPTDASALVARLRALSPGGAMALVDAAERFWLAVRAEGDSPEWQARAPTAELLRAVGLLRASA